MQHYALRPTDQTLVSTPRTRTLSKWRNTTAVTVRPPLMHCGGAAKPRPPGGVVALRAHIRAHMPPTLVVDNASQPCTGKYLQFNKTAAPSSGETRVMHATHATHVRLHTQAKYAPPRAWDASDQNQHYAKLYPTPPGVTSRVAAAINRMATAIMHPVLSPQLRDTLRRTALSGHSHGKGGAARKHGKPLRDTLEGALRQCPTEVWQAVFAAWRAYSGETLDHKSTAHTLLGDREGVHSAHSAHNAPVHEEVFRALHACTLQACVENWQRSHAKKKLSRRGTRATLARVDSLLRSVVRRRWSALRAQGKERQFNDTWIHTRAATMHAGRPDPILLQLRHVPAAPPGGATVIASGDGAGETPKERKAAGWGGIVHAACTARRAEPTIDLYAAPVVIVPGEHGYRGAEAPTNNAAELLAAESMLDAAAAAADIGEWAEVQTDSRIAILAALGVRPKTGRRRRKRVHARDARAAGAPPARSTRPNEVLTVRVRSAYQRAKEKLGHRLILRKIKGHSGHEWNEVADALAAVGRTIATGRQPNTAEVQDRLRRAVDDGRPDREPTVTCHGFAMAWSLEPG